MSRIGKLAIQIPEGVSVETDDRSTKIKGPKGELTQNLPKGLNIEKTEDEIKVSIKKETGQNKALFGTTRALLANMVTGVTKGWSKTLELVGTGYRAEVTGDTLTILIGFSHPVKVKAPGGITFKVVKSDITVEGIDKQLVGQVAANIRGIRPPEPYKGKGIRYKDEVVRRKAGKAAKVAGATN